MAGIRHRQDKEDDVPEKNIKNFKKPRQNGIFRSPYKLANAGWQPSVTSSREYAAKQLNALSMSWPHIFLAIATVTIIWASAAGAPNALTPILIITTLIWGIIRPKDYLTLVFPSLLPLSVIELPGWSGRSPLAVIMLIILVAVFIRRNRQAFISLKRLPLPIIGGWLWILVAETVSASMMAGGEVGTLIMIRVVRTAMFIMVVMSVVRTADIRKIASGWVIFGFLQLMAAILLEREFGTVLAIRGTVIWGLGSVYSATALVANVGFLAVAAAFGVLAFVWGRTKTRTWPAWIFALAVTVAALYSGRRQALVAILASILLVLIAQRGWRAITAVVLALAAVAIISRVRPVNEFLEGRASIIHEIREEPGGTGYIAIFRAGIATFLEKPIFGVGLGNFSKETDKRGVLSDDRLKGASPHNSIIRIFAETGLIGGIGILLLMAGVGGLATKAWARFRHEGGGSITLIASGLGGLVVAGAAVTLLDDYAYVFVLAQFISICHHITRGRNCLATKNIGKYSMKS